MKKYLLSAALFAFGLVLAVPAAQASPIVFNLDTSAAFGNAVYGTVTLDLITSGAHAGQIKIDVALGGSGKTFKIVDTGGHEAFGFNTTIAGPYSASTFQMTDFSPDAPFTANYAPDTNPEFGAFDMALNSACDNPGACEPVISAFTFYVSHTGGFSDVNQLVDLTSTPTYAYFSVDALCLTGCDAAGQTGVIGAVNQPTPRTTQEVPEPASVMLLGFGFAAAAIAKRKFVK